MKARGLSIALAVIFAGLLGRAAIDKILAIRTGPESVALWAQLQSIGELVIGITAAGVGPGLTVLVAQSARLDVQRRLLRAALVYGLALSAVAALVIVAAAGPIASWVASGGISPGLAAFAAASGCVAVSPSLLTSLWLGLGRRDLILWLNSATMLVMAGAAFVAAAGTIAQSVLAAQAAAALAASLLVWRNVAGLPASRAARPEVRRLRRYVVAGLSIGILSPGSVLVARRVLSDALSWDDVGVVQALWRSSEWITAIASGLLWLVVLPRLSASWRSERFVPELLQVLWIAAAVAAGLLGLVWFHQAVVLELLYDKRFVIGDRAAALFLLGDWLRIGAWVFLFALFAMQRTRLIALGELFSVPLFAVLLLVFRDGLTLERAGLLYCLSYAAYFVFNAVAALRGARLPAPI